VGRDGRSLRRRFLEHCNNPKPQIRDAHACFSSRMHYWYTATDEQSAMLLEAQLIDCLGPPANLVRGCSIPGRIGMPQRA
jgi:hypothetical protein